MTLIKKANIAQLLVLFLAITSCAKEIKKVEPKKAEEEVTKEPTKPKTEKAVKEAPKREKVESLVRTEESQKEFENKMNTLDQKAQEQYGKKFDELNPKRQIKNYYLYRESRSG